MAAKSATVQAFVKAMPPDVKVNLNYPLAPLTTYRIGGPADIFAVASNETALVAIAGAADRLGLPFTVLGGGSNTLIGDGGIEGIVVQLAGQAFEQLSTLDGGNRIAVGAATPYPVLTRHALLLGWPSALGWCGTPGQVGGALRMNAGTRLGEIGTHVEEVRIATKDGMRTLKGSDLHYRYRSSSFPSGSIISTAILKNPHDHTEDAALLLEKAQTLAAKRKLTQPKIRSAGSIFKNPDGHFAGQLIESVGLKGHQIGRAQISATHANFIVNLGGASANDVRALIELAKHEVHKQKQILLECEVKFAGIFVGK
jgi:UDP-N-acetylmuramate dehydrogenase